jgi:transcription elongation factor Elf1
LEYDKFEEDEDRRDKERAQAKLLFREFECPSCSANNPTESGFGNGAEVLCNYCGTEFKATVSDEGRLKLREL